MNGKALKKADLQADNGVIHFVSEMLEPMVTEDIPAVLTSDGRFGTLLTAIEMAGLGEMLTQSTKLYIPCTINILKFQINKKKVRFPSISDMVCFRVIQNSVQFH